MDNTNDLKKEYMLRAISLAKAGRGFTNPNPMVGAVIVKDGRIIGEGYHKKCGELHAERDAFTKLSESAEGATIYVTLEPCCHYGKQPPCTEAIVEHKIARVVIGSRDPNPLVAGKGVAYLRDYGIEVIEDFLRDECDEINPVFFHYITTGKPYVVMKYAMTLDGKIATHTGDSKWITGEKAREHVHQERSSYAAIMAGIGTVLADDPVLNVRGIENAHQPVRIIVDSRLRIPIESNIVKTSKEYKTIIAYNFEAAKKYHGDKFSEVALALENNSISLFDASDFDSNASEKDIYTEKSSMENTLIDKTTPGQVSLVKLINYIGELKLDSVYVEGGGRIHESLIRENLVDKVSAYIAPKIFGGRDAKTPVEGLGVKMARDSFNLKISSIKQLGEDVLIECNRMR